MSARLLPFLMMLLMSANPALGATAPAAAELTALLREFLHAASVNDRAVFDRFFAEDVIYTRSAGVTIDKAAIMRSFNQPRPPGAASPTYDADDITVHQYGDCAVVNFRLVAKSNSGDPAEAAQYYRNTGTFVKHDGRWQAVAWQSTRVPPAETSK